MEEEKKKSEETSLEDMFQELEGIITGMEDRGISLEDAFALYEKGMNKIRQCNEKLDLVEKKMSVIANDGTTVPFE